MDLYIPICKGTPFKPKIQLLMERLGMSRGDVFLNCFLLWAWADTLTTDGFIGGVTIEHVAASARIPLDFCLSLGAEDIGWMVASQSKYGTNGVLLHDWCEHNGECAKRRRQNAARQAAFKSRRRK